MVPSIAIWSSSSGVNAAIDVLNQTYDIEEGRPWWKVKVTALALTLGDQRGYRFLDVIAHARSVFPDAAGLTHLEG